MAKKVLTTGKFTFDSVEYGVTALTMSKKSGDVDVTDTDTSGSEKEYLGGRQEKTFTVEMWKDVTEADPTLGGSGATGELDFEGFTYAGTMILTEIAQSATIDDAVKLTVNGRFSGTVTETVAT